MNKSSLAMVFFSLCVSSIGGCTYRMTNNGYTREVYIGKHPDPCCLKCADSTCGAKADGMAGNGRTAAKSSPVKQTMSTGTSGTNSPKDSNEMSSSQSSYLVPTQVEVQAPLRTAGPITSAFNSMKQWSRRNDMIITPVEAESQPPIVVLEKDAIIQTSRDDRAVRAEPATLVATPCEERTVPVPADPMRWAPFFGPTRYHDSSSNSSASPSP